MVTIIICDDEQQIRQQLLGYIKAAEKELKQSFSVILCESGEELLEKAAEADIILLDIAMGGINGMEAAKELRARNSKVQIIFITSMTDYALEGYSVHAFGFLKKPVQYGTLLQQIEDVLSVIDSEKELILSFQSGPDIARISSADIYYIEVMGHSVTVHTKAASSVYPARISDLEEKLKDYGFFRCHKSYLINFSAVRRILPAEISMADGSAVPVSKHRRKEFLAAFADYEGRKL